MVRGHDAAVATGVHVADRVRVIGNPDTGIRCDLAGATGALRRRQSIAAIVKPEARLRVIPRRQRVVRMGCAFADLVLQRYRVAPRPVHIGGQALGCHLVFRVMRVARLKDAVDPTVGALQARPRWFAVGALCIVHRHRSGGCCSHSHQSAGDQRHRGNQKAYASAKQSGGLPPDPDLGPNLRPKLRPRRVARAGAGRVEHVGTD
jgi:hypothetical protein